MKSKPIKDQISVENLNKITGYVSCAVDFINELGTIVNPSRGYNDDANKTVKEAHDELGKHIYKVKGFKKLISLEDSALASAIIDVNSLN